MIKMSAERQRFRRTKRIAVCLTLIVLASGIWLMRAYMERERPYTLESFAMGSYVRQTVWGRKSEDAAAENVQRIEALEREISWRRDGGIAQLNRQAGGEPVTMEEDTGALLAEMLELCEKSGGALDITLGPVTRLWNFDGEPRLPDARELEAALALVDYRKVAIDREEHMYAVPNEDGSHIDCLDVSYRVSLAEPGMAVDLGAVGKGAACDVMIQRYTGAFNVGAVVAVGGSVGLRGEKPSGGPWRVSVRDPAGNGSLGVLELPAGFVSTSGSYEKFFEQDGKTYHHILDPRTGYPAESGLVSVTVFVPYGSGLQYPGAISDALATACFVLGLEDGTSLLAEYGAEAVFVDTDGNITLTEGLSNSFTPAYP